MNRIKLAKELVKVAREIIEGKQSIWIGKIIIHDISEAGGRAKARKLEKKTGPISPEEGIELRDLVDLKIIDIFDRQGKKIKYFYK